MVEKKPRRADRPFRLVDAMILTAATAVGLAGVRGLMEGLGPMTYPTGLSTGRLYLAMAETFLLVGSPLLAAWSAAVVPIRLIPPRPPRRRLGVQPGMVAACGTILALAAVVGAAVACNLAPTGAFTKELATWVLAAPGAVGVAILASWMTLILGRRWRAEPTWIDRLGRVLATAWFATWLAALHILHLS
ncbi:hypothetical protein [Paludisphaera soli]|uniref:hypothetical protein n=1 Tax=Paludisphaera soli TaxID=2712865 RepID=UPI0013ED5217|nr:hypothetical protein [Paludisphaera soli]